MRKVIGMGETVLDIIFKNGAPIGAVPGGSTFNTMVSLGRAGVVSTFLSATGNDRVGRYAVDFLHQNGVNADGVSLASGSKSAISLAFLDEHNEAEYLFYKDTSHDQPDLVLPEIAPDDIVIVGSYYALAPATHPQVVALLDQARQNGAIIYYDVNFRPAHKDEVMRLTANLIENFEHADLIRGSRQDFEIIYEKGDPQTVYQSEIAFYCKRFICTDGANPVEIFADGGFRSQYPVDSTPTVSTIGAGDNFNAGLLYALIKHRIGRENLLQGLSREQWDSLLDYALSFAADCCKGIQNYISADFGSQMKQALNT